jgi:hypothetical protein
MKTDDHEEIFQRNRFIQQEMKTQGSKEVTTNIKNKSYRQIERIQRENRLENLIGRNLTEEEGNKHTSNNDCCNAD